MESCVEEEKLPVEVVEKEVQYSKCKRGTVEENRMYSL